MTSFLGNLLSNPVLRRPSTERVLINEALVRPVEMLLDAVRQFDVDRAYTTCLYRYEANQLLHELYTTTWLVVSSVEQADSGTGIVVVDLVQAEALPQRVTFRVKRSPDRRWYVLDWI